ncbi:MAG TPA: hypothetical protein VIW67_13705 [Terriglobales bacterium]|jgi:hypothetical protein
MKRKSYNPALLAGAKLGFRPDEVVEVLGSQQMFDEMLRANWLRPVVRRHKLMLFDKGDVHRAWARILNGEQPGN